MLNTVLEKYFGYTSFRAGQEEIIDSVLSGRSTLAILPTGGGKSLCYQVPALCLHGLTIVISPLIALMKDQVDALLDKEIPAALYNSTQGREEQNQVIRDLESGKVKILYVAPERLESKRFIRAVSGLEISLLAVDEAHCISQWGHDFRPSYQAIPRFLQRITSEPVMAALTATATPEVRRDIVKRLEMKDAAVFVQGFDRQNLHFCVEYPGSKKEYLLRYIKSRKGQAGIVYASTRRKTEELCDLLRRNRVRAAFYHAGMEDRKRHRAQEAFIRNKVHVMVATNAFGMGIDKPDVRYVLHHNMPRDIESYFQEAGRAGRDGNPAECVLLYHGNDLYTQRYFNDLSREKVPADILNKREQKLQDMWEYCRTGDCLRSVILSYFGERTRRPRCGNCSNCRKRDILDISQTARHILNCVSRVKAGRTSIVEILTGSRSQKIRRNKWDRLDEYNLLTGVPRRELKEILKDLLERGFLEKSTGMYPVLSLSAAGRSLLKEGGKLLCSQPVENQSEELT